MSGDSINAPSGMSQKTVAFPKTLFFVHPTLINDIWTKGKRIQKVRIKKSKNYLNWKQIFHLTSGQPRYYTSHRGHLHHFTWSNFLSIIGAILRVKWMFGDSFGVTDINFFHTSITQNQKNINLKQIYNRIEIHLAKLEEKLIAL